MRLILNISRWLTNSLTWIGIMTLVLMMVFIFAGVVMRQFGSPILGSVEIVQFLMVITIMCGLSYCESQDGHIKVELIFEKLPQKVQSIMLIMIDILPLACILTIAVVYFKVAVHSFMNGSNTSELLTIPFFPFEMIIAICFTVWFLQLLGKTLTKLVKED